MPGHGWNRTYSTINTGNIIFTWAHNTITHKKIKILSNIGIKWINRNLYFKRVTHINEFTLTNLWPSIKIWCLTYQIWLATVTCGRNLTTDTWVCNCY
jgi:hypothetical protein